MQLAAQGLPASVLLRVTTQSVKFQWDRAVLLKMFDLSKAKRSSWPALLGEIQGLVAARVHLAIPEKSVFARASVPPSASVFVQMEDGRSLSRQQISAIVHLVSSSVPSLPKGEVTVVDQYGNLLSQPGRNAASAMTDSQLEHRIRLEDIYRQRIISIVTPMVGGGNVMAEVNLGIDFTRSEVTEELVDPERNALRSEQRSSDTSSELTARGIPGATANRAPTQTEVTTEQGDKGAEGGVANRSSSEVKNYEVSRTISTTSKPGTQITRIQASVLVRELEVVNAETGLSRSTGRA